MNHIALEVLSLSITKKERIIAKSGDFRNPHVKDFPHGASFNWKLQRIIQVLYMFHAPVSFDDIPDSI